MKVFIVLALCLSAAYCRPQYAKEKPSVPFTLYDAPPPEQPSGLYEIPEELPEPSKVAEIRLAPPEAALMPMPYDLAWDVSDSDSGNLFSHKEASSDGIISQGEYSVLLPDGRTQVVTFTVKGDEGYVARVKYVK